MKSEPFFSGRRLKIARILALAFVILVISLIFVYRDRVQELSSYGYPGIFLLSLLANATLIFPIPGVALTFAMGAVFHPIGVALAAGAGAALGELTGYLAGFSGEAVIPHGPAYQRIQGWTQHYGKWMILALAFIPNPLFDVAGAAAGALRMPLPRFLFWAWLGKTLKMLVFAYAGSVSIDWLLHLLP